MAKLHVLDLFDMQAEVADLAGYASLVAPPLASAFGTSAAELVGRGTYDPDTTVTYRDLAPLLDIISRLFWTTDRIVHVQQMAGDFKSWVCGYIPKYPAEIGWQCLLFRVPYR